MKNSNYDLIAYRIRRARDALEEAQILAQAERWNTCVNRLYYACFYAVSALLAAEGLSSSKHSGTRSLFNKSFVKTGSVEKSLARVYNDLYERRQESDYVDFVEFQEEQVTPWITRAETFVERITEITERQSQDHQESQEP